MTKKTGCNSAGFFYMGLAKTQSGLQVCCYPPHPFIAKHKISPERAKYINDG
jgi:hypothetical protein